MNKSFITVTPDRGQNNRTLSVKADANETYVSRSATFKVEGEGITKSVSIEQDPNPYVYIDCGYIFSSANIQEPYEVVHSGLAPTLSFNVKFANFIFSSKHIFVIKNISSLPVLFNNPVISSISFVANDQTVKYIPLNEFTTEVVPNSGNEGTILSIVDITPDKLYEIVTTINSMHDVSSTGAMRISIFIESNGGPSRLLIDINVI